MKFHCSSMPKLMSASGKWTQTNESALLDIAIEQKYGMRKPIETDAMRKGTMVESDVIDLYANFKNKKLFKNKKFYENSTLCGTPDIITDEGIIDIKSSFDIWTFSSVNEKSAKDDYYWQGVSYCYLIGKSKFTLVYGLVDTPAEIQFNLYRRLAYTMTEEEAENVIARNHTYSHISPNKRLKIYEWDIPLLDFTRLDTRIAEAKSRLEEIINKI